MKLESIKAIDDLEVFLNSRGLHKEAQELRKLAFLPAIPLGWKAIVGLASLVGGATALDYYGNHTHLYERIQAGADDSSKEVMRQFVNYVMRQDVVILGRNFPKGAPEPLRARLRGALWDAYRNKSQGSITEDWIQDTWSEARGESIWNFDDEDFYEETLRTILQHRDAEIDAQKVLDRAIAELESQQKSPSTGAQREALAKHMTEGYTQQEAINLVKK